MNGCCLFFSLFLSTHQVDYKGDSEMLALRFGFLDLCREAFVTAFDDARRIMPRALQSSIGDDDIDGETATVDDGGGAVSVGRALTSELTPLQTSGTLTREQTEAFLDIVQTVFDVSKEERKKKQ